MSENLERKFPRRDLFRLALAGTGAVVIGSQLPEPASAQSVDLKNKRRARYQAESAEVRNFYRVNSYPAR
ncbi:formate dehydrogenase [Bradyrhizobium sp.]|jgi:hypothetical protein|uniref:formate dehydrogenase n=1 Tax=Bradyrhizobium sp. TaxID=376 RepID=UPI003C298D55